jgi:hypothetical protein
MDIALIALIISIPGAIASIIIIGQAAKTFISTKDKKKTRQD